MMAFGIVITVGMLERCTKNNTHYLSLKTKPRYRKVQLIGF